MRTFTVSLLSLSLGLATVPTAWAANSAAQQQLLDQVRVGEASNREDLVTQSLYRLELIDPNNPDVIAARLRYLLRQGDAAGAQKQLDRLAQLAPDSSAYKNSRSEIQLTTAEGRQALQQARLLTTTGHVEEGLAVYDKLFKGAPPDGALSVEYWTAVARLPARHNEAVNQLKNLNKTMPGNVQLQSTLARMLFDDDKRDEAFAVLEQMAKTNAGHNTAADIWYDQIKSMPTSEASIQALQRFLLLFTTGDLATTAKAQLDEQKKQMADPAFRAKAEQLAIEANKPQSWEIYWPMIRKADAALKAGDLDLAERTYQQARRVDSTDSYAVLGLGDVAMARKDSAAAERYYQQALRLDKGNSNAVRGLANIYRAQSPEKATAFIESLSASQRKSVDDIERSLTNDRLSQQAEALENEGKFAQAAALQRQRLALDPGSVWVTYRLSRDLYSAGQHSEADALMRGLAQQKPNDPEQIYANGLYLSGNNQDQAALTHLNRLPRSQWNDNIRELADRLQFNQVLENANRLRDAGQEDQAIALLKQQPSSTRIDLILADWAQQRGDTQTAVEQYHAVLAKEPENQDARLGLVEVYLADGDKASAREQLAKLPPLEASSSINVQRRVALAQSGLGNTAAAQQIFSRIVPQAKSQPPSMDSALVLRDAARVEAASGNPQQGLEDYKDAMVATGITPARPQDNDSFTRLMRNDEKDDWLKRGVRSDAADLYRQQDVNVTLEHDYWGSSGTGGYSDLKAHTTMLQADAPLADGRMFFRSDFVNMNAGTFSTSGGTYDDSWGTCSLGDDGCRGGTKQSDSGASIAVGWKNDTWNMDLGTTPIGFNVVDVVGGLSYSDDLGPFGYTLNVHRRPISSSLLAFGGQKDNDNDGHTGTTWGGVRATGAGVSMSYDKGEANGVWASLGADSLNGKNVEDNWRVRWMTGYYYKVINENNRRVTIGLNNMIWHYDKDLSGYTLGQGGYYSPQSYLSFAVPVLWRERTENWSWELGASGSWSHSRTKTMPRYPLNNLIPSQWQDEAASQISQGSSSNGFGYTARGLLERRVTSNWFIGAAVDIQQAKDYAPSHFLMYVRYSAAGWQGDMDLPPQPLVPYADW
ncbi:cellulose synthase complex outer membrane protein BcsC [Trabulsiella odontotermitis]|uniref:Cellulose synthase n=1 Tax=Trabulsiella odontotermitis TaxID=379893 RepID=A0A0L0GZ31_9ENTR|nr:cellulose synthase complex outer membrane protein BcsC [Trabulsiella odontotermitis]KNC94460.1 cellulose synthase [Trabulsiella odontotermitis]